MLRTLKRLFSRRKAFGGIRGDLRVEARDKGGKLIGVHCKNDLTTKAFAQLIQLGILATAETIRDTSGTSHSETTGATTGSSPTIAAGTSGTSAAFSDYALGTPTETVAATVNALSGNAFTVTGTITAGSTRAYQEVGITVSVNGHTYLITHDTFSTLNVSSGGTLSVNYTFTFT
jgi:hypothetical protein